MRTKCKCGKTKDLNGFCDGSHAKKSRKTIYYLLALFAFITFANANLISQETVDLSTSNVFWKAYKVAGEHEGRIDLKQADLTFEDGQLSGGIFVINMMSIVCTDLSGDYKQKLEGHLKSEDFFNVSKFPEASLEIINVSQKRNVLNIVADITIKEITERISFQANVSNDFITSNIKIDRSVFDVRYGSSSFFDNLGDNLIYDEFDITVKLNLK